MQPTQYEAIITHGEARGSLGGSIFWILDGKASGVGYQKSHTFIAILILIGIVLITIIPTTTADTIMMIAITIITMITPHTLNPKP